MLKQGDNVLAGLVGHGWYSGTIGNGGYRFYGTIPAVLVQLEVTYTDGTMQQVVTDASWKRKASPILSSDFMLGENYDARLEIGGWDVPGLDDRAWGLVKVRDEAAKPLQSQVSEPVRQVLELKPKTLSEPKPGCWTFDLGQNMVGVVRLKVSAPAGTKLTLRHAEVLNPDGTLYTKNLRTAVSIDTYICKGGGEEIFQPHFTFHGFRYVEITGLEEKPSLDTITGVVVASDTPSTGEFACSDPRINQLYSNIVWGQRGNFLSVPTDCPQRNERLGWTGDAQVFIRSATYNADVAAFFSRWLVDLEDSQRADGAFPDFSPATKTGMGTAGWGDAGVICPWTLYHVYGDLRQLEDHYPTMVRWVEFCRQNSVGLIRPNRGYGDWLSIGADTPKELIGTAYFAYSTKLVARAAKALGRIEDAAKYEQLFLDIKAAFNKKYVADDGRITATVEIKNKDKVETVVQGNTQTCYLLALKFDLLSAENRAKAAQYLVEDITTKKDHLSTGFIGVSYLLPVLTQQGKTETAFKLFLQDTFPSWLFSVKHGATTIWERWDGWTPEKGFQDPGMNSFNHYAYGSCGEWMFASLAGIDTDGPGFKKLIIGPTPGDGITWVKASYHSINGSIVSNWAIQGGKLTMEVTIPINTTATVYVPTQDAATVTESGKPAAKAAGVKFLRQEQGRSIYNVEAGSYRFECPAN
jgi:alpha-L-rhamnosidase